MTEADTGKAREPRKRAARKKPEQPATPAEPAAVAEKHSRHAGHAGSGWFVQKDGVALARRENPLMRREEFTGLVEHHGRPTPTREEILDRAAAALQAPKELMVLDRVSALAGRSSTAVSILLYKKREDMPAAAKKEKPKPGQAAQPAQAAPEAGS